VTAGLVTVMRLFAQSIVETVRHPLLILDGELRVIVANPAFYRTFELTPANSVGRPFHALAGGRMARLRGLLEEILHSDNPVVDFDVSLDDTVLGQRMMMLNGRRVANEETGQPMVLLSIEDVTAHRLAEEELRRLNGELEQRVEARTAQLETSNRELEAFCYSVSHDLRSPVRAVAGFSGELLRNHAQSLDERGMHYLTRVLAASERMAVLIDGLLELSRLDREVMRHQRVDISALAATVGEELRQLEPERKVTLTVDSGLAADCDPRLIRVALENLIGNAWKFTANKPLASIRIGREQQRGQAAFFVRDDGAGFDMGHASKMFGAFQRLHGEREFPGNGIGLATVQRVVHRHGGEVWAEGEAGVGATFYFTLSNDGPCP
jgi:signal transduction histidine kinase